MEGPIMSRIMIIFRLGRLHMTMFSAITYVATSIVACDVLNIALNPWRLFTSYLFVFSCQMVAHYLGEYYDVASDRLNSYGSRLTGGSGVFKSGSINTRISLIMSSVFIAFSLILIVFVLPRHLSYLSLSMIAIAYQYSAPPFSLNHRALGELAAVVVQNILLPLFAASSQSDEFRSVFDARLSHIIWPSSFIKFSLFLILNLNDRRPDWLAGKVTIPVLCGDRFAINLSAASMLLAYISVWVTMPTLSMRIAAMASFPLGVYIIFRARYRTPYRYDDIVALSLQHCSLVIWAILLDTSSRRAWNIGMEWSMVVVAFLFQYFIKSCQSIRSLSAVSGNHNPDPSPVVICGAGVAGLTSAIVLHRLGIPFVVIDKRSAKDSGDGADLALWPAAVLILRELGVPQSVFDNHSRPIDWVHMQRMSDNHLLHRVDMRAVTQGTGERFRLIPRRVLLDQLAVLVPNAVLRYDTKLVDIQGDASESSVRVIMENMGDHSSLPTVINSRLVIGADGVYSAVRGFVQGAKEPVRYCGEVCYRGTIDIPAQDQGAELNTATFTFPRIYRQVLGVLSPNTMTIHYGNGLRAAFGMIDGDQQQKGYWWVKQCQSDQAKPDRSKWPDYLKQLYDLTETSNLYRHPIIDRKSDAGSWSAFRSVLVGDAAHPVTPNMGQGACMAIEDGFILSTLIGEYHKYADGDIEACYQYETKRRGHVRSIAKSSYIQSKIGQFSNPTMVWMRDNLLYNLPSAIFVNKLRQNNVNIALFLSSFSSQTTRSADAY